MCVIIEQNTKNGGTNLSIDKKFGLQATAVEEWLPWGGIVRPGVMKQKDGSMFSIIEYEPYSYLVGQEYPKWNFRRGWVVWQEIQHTGDSESKYYLVICWNPFYQAAGKYITNALTPKVQKKNVIDYFELEIKHFLTDFSSLTKVRLLTYQELMDVLSFSLSQGDDHQEMPDTPLYMDALLSEDIDMKFGANDIYIDGRHLYVVSMLSPGNLSNLYQGIRHMTYRHSRRLVCLGHKESFRYLKKYTAKWFPKRNVVRKYAMDGLLGQFNGYYTDSFQFLLEKEDDLPFRKFFEKNIDETGINYIVQRYGLKETFWGSIPGLFLANQRPPVVGFQHLSEFLGAEAIEPRQETNILDDASSRLVPTTVDVREYFKNGKEGT